MERYCTDCRHVRHSATSELCMSPKVIALEGLQFNPVNRSKTKYPTAGYARIHTCMPEAKFYSPKLHVRIAKVIIKALDL